MAKGIEIGIGSDTKAFKQGVDIGIIAPLDDAQDALKELGDSRGPEELERSLKDAQKATERLEDETKRTAATIDREYRDSYRKLKNNSDDAFRGTSAATGEFKQEALQNFSEVTSSFDGSMTSIQDLAQGTLGGLASGIAGPIGLAAGGAAVAVGLIGAAITNVGDASEADKDKAAEWAQSYVEAGGKILTTAQGTAKALEIILDPDQFKKAEESAEDWGVTTSTAVAALSGQQWAIDAVTASLEDMNSELDDYANSDTGPTVENLDTFGDLADQYERGATKLKDLNGEMAAGANQADVYSQYLAELATNTEGASKTIDEFGDSIYALPDGTTIYIDAETGQATQDADAIENKIYSIEDKTVKVDVDTVDAENTIGELFSKPRGPLKIKVQLDSADSHLYKLGSAVR